MTSSPPTPIPYAPSPHVRLAPELLRAGWDGVTFFCVEGAPHEACQTSVGADGSVTFLTELDGRVLEVRQDVLVLDCARVRYLLPDGIDLGGLAGHRLSIVIVQRYDGGARATIDARIRTSEASDLILWAHDGRIPKDRGSPVGLRAMVGPDGARLALRSGERIVSVPCPGVASTRIESANHHVALSRLEGDDVSFVMLRA